MSEELKLNENVGAPQPDALAQIASVDPSPAVGGMHPFTPAMLSRLKKQRQLLSELEHALKNHEFCFFLQPKCNSMTRAIVGMEALVRWNHPTRGCVPPSEFMPLLESTGLVTQLDQYIWESVCKTLHKWQESGSNLVPVSVNVSVVDIVNLDVPQIFSNLVEKYQLEPKLLLAEITETMLAENASLVENTIQGLHRKGFSVMMDDFGSGYSSLNMLKDTNVDAIKLDMKLIDMNQQNRSKGVQIVESVVDMGPPPESAHHRRGRGNAGAGLHAAGRRLPVYAGLLFLQAHAGGERRGPAGPAQQRGLLGYAPRPDAPRPDAP